MTSATLGTHRMRISSIGYCLKQGLKNIWRNKMFSLASVATMSACIFLFGIFFCVVENFQYMVKEADIKAWRDYHQLHFIQCACRFTENCATCGGAKGSKRDEMKELVAKFRETSDVIEYNIFNSVHNVNLRTIIGYHKDDMEYNFLDDYDQRGNKGVDKEKE